MDFRGLPDDFLKCWLAAWISDLKMIKITHYGYILFTCTGILWLSKQQCSVPLWLGSPSQTEWAKLSKTTSGYSICLWPQGKFQQSLKKIPESVLFYVKDLNLSHYTEWFLPPPLALSCIFAELYVLFRVSPDAAQMCVTLFLDSVPGRKQE